ncbi:MAG: pyridoxamine 5'-phosphate oxidase family protein [Deinococcus sp.]|nr:pyridoxamine 5'-phosphate oxidase family protein [Deinococcus sp.]
MPANLTSDQVWNEVEKQMFAVLGTVNRKGQPRTAGIVYKVKDRHLYIVTGYSSYKAKNVQHNSHVSVTVTVDKHIPFLPWVKIPAATITFQGEASLLHVSETESRIQTLLLGNLKLDEKILADLCIIKVKPVGQFITYGIGVPLLTMRDPEAARGRAPV